MAHKKFISVISSISVAALSILSISPASAENLNSNYSSQSGIYSTQDNISPDTLNEARKEFIAAGYSYDVVDLAQGKFFKFYIEEGVTIFLPSEQLLTTDAVSPSAYSATASEVKAGKHDGGFWLELSPKMQNRVNTIGFSALGFGACFIPGVGWAGCAAFTAAMAVVGIQVAESDCASKNQTLRVELNWRGDHEGSRCI